MPTTNERGRPPAPGVAAARALNRTPLTPKVAAKASPVISPLARKPQGPPPTLANVQRDEFTTPVSSFLASNVTPRSGSRQNRVESTTSTPSGTPIAERTNDAWDNSSRVGLGITAGDAERQGRSPPDSAGDAGDSKFFYASDAKNIQQPIMQRPTPVVQKQPTFFYANGTNIESATRRISPPSNSHLTTIPMLNPDPSSNKFFYANGEPDIPPKPVFPISSSASSLSTTSRMAPTAARPTSSYSSTGVGTAFLPRPTSPIKPMGSPNQGIMRAAMSPISPNRSQAASPMASTQAPPPPPPLQFQQQSDIPIAKIKRQESIDVSPPLLRTHSRNASIPGSEPITLPKLTLTSNPFDGPSPPLSPGATQASLTMASILQAAEAIEEERESLPSGMQSPTKTNYSDAAINELVANARRERKVQDLEITNASLEAINRTLERQLRKQTSELRRFRRLSRSGRFSLNSVPNSRVVSSALTDPAIDLSELSERDQSEDEDEDEDEDDSFDDTLHSNSPPDSPSGMVASPAAALRRKRDERRLQLDLSKHQELLIDSQKMNQSIKRCLNWTEILIKEGQKALEYHVRVSDIEFGGRVLTPLDEEDEEASVQDGTITEASDGGLEPPWSKGPQDRDSGIELHAPEAAPQ